MVALVAAALAAGCGGGEGTEVSMVGGHRFGPETLTVAAGETVTWVNDDSEAHTVTAYGDALPAGADYWSSGGAPSEEAAREAVADALLTQGESYEMTFDEPGTYRYFCIPHEGDGMKGEIVVEG